MLDAWPAWVLPNKTGNIMLSALLIPTYEIKRKTSTTQVVHLRQNNVFNVLIQVENPEQVVYGKYEEKRSIVKVTIEYWPSRCILIFNRKKNSFDTTNGF